MRILLDENIPVQLRSILSQHDVASVNDAAIGWKSIKNGLLLDRMEGHFDLLLTADRNMYAQQNLLGRRVSILVVPTNRRKSVLAMSEKIADVIAHIGVGEYAVIDLTGEIDIRPHSSNLDED